MSININLNKNGNINLFNFLSIDFQFTIYTDWNVKFDTNVLFCIIFCCYSLYLHQFCPSHLEKYENRLESSANSQNEIN